MGGDDDAGGSSRGRRTTVILPTGSGKTSVGLWLLESLLAVAPEPAALVCVPTLPLIDQTVAAYRRDSVAVAQGQTRLLLVASKSSAIAWYPMLASTCRCSARSCVRCCY